jgi:RND family efflux transporter MFP subunit
MNSTMNSNPQSPAPPPAPPIRLGKIFWIVAVLVVIGLIAGFVPRWQERRQLDRATVANDVPVVEVIAPGKSEPDLGTPVPAEVQPFIQASIHARASGYLKIWYADIGAVVTNGQVLAEIETPELDEQILQARAQVDQARASLAIAKTTAARWADLVKTASVSDQDNAEKQADYALAQANVEAAEANLHRLIDLKAYDRVTAPFAGIVTTRNTDIGQLISADSGVELFRLAQTDPLRVYARVPQPLVHAVVPGQDASLFFQENPGKVYQAKVTRTAGAVDPSSRTLQVELQVANPHNEILAGSYAQVRFQESAATPVLTISDNALIFRAQGMQLAVLDAGNKVTLHDVTLGRDFGNTVEILSGLQAADRVVNNPPDSIAEGEQVEIAQALGGNTNTTASAK